MVLIIEVCTVGINYYEFFLMDEINLQCPVDDALNLVHDVVLCKQVLEIPEKGFSLNCSP